MFLYAQSDKQKAVADSLKKTIAEKQKELAGKQKAAADSLKKYQAFVKKTQEVLEWVLPPFISNRVKKKDPMVVEYDSVHSRYVFDVLPGYLRGFEPGIHQLEETRYMQLTGQQGYRSEMNWGELQNIVPSKEPAVSARTEGGPVVYGFHPFWMGNAYYNYDFGLLTRVAYFSYALDPATGKSRSPYMAHSWRSSALQQKAHNAGCKVDLVVSCYGEQKNSALLNNPAAQHTLADSLLFLLNLKHATAEGDSSFRGDGITLDLEGFPDDPNAGRALTQFIAGLRSRMDQARKDEHLALNLVLPIWAPYSAYEFDSLKNYIDLFIVCGYDYYLEGSSTAGPSSVLVADSAQFYYTIDHSINYYLDKGMPRQKTVLSLPWYAKRCKTENGNLFSPALPDADGKLVTIEPYSLAHARFGTVTQPLRDSSGNAVYFPVQSHDGWEQTWSEDTFTLGVKYDYVLKKRLAGAGIWALGYGDDSPEMWQLLAKKFSGQPVPTESNVDVDSLIASNELALDKKKKAVLAPPADPLGSSVADVRYPSVVPVKLPQKDYGMIAVFCLAVLLGFAVIGFLVALFYESVREAVFSRDYFIYIVAVLLVVGALLILHATGLINRNSIVFIAGALGGAGVIAVLFRLVKKRKSEEPTP